MGNKVEEITARCIAALRDANHDSWSEAVIWDSILEAEKVITNYRPDVTAVDMVYSCTAGVRQSLAAIDDPPVNRLLSVKHNVSQDDLPGRSIRRTAVGDLDAIRPNWRSATPGGEIREYLHDEREPLIFDVYPPVVAGTKARLSYSAIPQPYGEVDGDTETTVNALYEPQIIEWALYRLFGHDVEGSANLTRSGQHLANFERMMGIKLDAEKYFAGKNLEHKR